MTSSSLDAHNASNAHARPHTRRGFLALVVGCIGVVYGDIGTSPLYAMREALRLVSDGGIHESEVLGIVSLIVWSLIIIVTLKYIFFITRADNKGEGGSLTLMALALGANVFTRTVVVLGMVGAALFYGDAILTPAISVLSAVEGLKLVTPIFEPYVVPLTLVILITLFLVQSHGTARVAKLFGPITLIWFISMGANAVPHLMEYPEAFQALLPTFGIHFLTEHSGIAFAVLGAIFLAVTGAETLYADMGHFGRRPIKIAWVCVVFPALILNYLGQGALILHNPETLTNPFFLMTPQWLLLPMVLLATAATIIASQAVITGAFSITRQAIQLGLLPRMEIRHTSESQAGQIFMPQINALLLIGVVVLVLEFKSSDAIASAYGIAVSGTMMTTTMLAFIVVWKWWKKPLWLAVLLTVPFLLIEFVFVSANMVKLFDGGYIPLMLAATLVILMTVWRRGSIYLMGQAHKASIPLADLLPMLDRSKPPRVPGTAIYLTSEPVITPTALMHNLKHNKIIHASNIILAIQTAATPRVPEDQRFHIEQLNDCFSRITLRFGYMETPNVPKALGLCRKQGLKFDIMATSFFLGRRSIKASPTSGLPLWQDRIFILLARNAVNATEFFHIPPGRVVELGTQVTI